MWCWPQLSFAALDSSASAVSAAEQAGKTQTIGGFNGWGLIPSDPSQYSVATGTILTFNYNSFHDVYLMSSQDSYDSCDFSAATTLAGTNHGGGSPN
ncbi:MAG: hypothetical protein SGPRY_008410, partial [Prymnesium sp.]